MAIYMLQVDGCLSDLTEARHYFKRRHVCELHLKALEVSVEGVVMRFCQQVRMGERGTTCVCLA